MWRFESWKRDGAGAGAVRGWGPLMSLSWFAWGLSTAVGLDGAGGVVAR